MKHLRLFREVSNFNRPESFFNVLLIFRPRLISINNESNGRVVNSRELIREPKERKANCLKMGESAVIYMRNCLNRRVRGDVVF